jgi:hypothetical protein
MPPVWCPIDIGGAAVDMSYLPKVTAIGANREQLISLVGACREGDQSILARWRRVGSQRDGQRQHHRCKKGHDPADGTRHDPSKGEP